MAAQGTLAKDITNKVNSMTIDDPDPPTDNHTVESVLSGDTITIIQQPPWNKEAGRGPGLKKHLNLAPAVTSGTGTLSNPKNLT
jgi:hypothetical protein